MKEIKDILKQIEYYIDKGDIKSTKILLATLTQKINKLNDNRNTNR